MGNRKRTYVTITGDVHTYKYDYKSSEMNHKPTCKCGKRMKYVMWRKMHDFENIGYICELCNIVYISHRYKVLRIREKPI